MKKQICTLIVGLSALLWCSFGLARSPDISVEILGESLAEKKIRWVWKHRFDFIQACAMSNCYKQEPLKSILPKLAQIVDITSDGQLQFKSEKENPGFFSSNLGESHRIAITGREAGSFIYFNTDLIGDLSFENMVALLFHEWTHHLGIADDAQRLPDQVGALMAKNFLANLLYSPYRGPDNLQLVSAVFQFPVPSDYLPEKFFYTDFAFFTDGTILLDTDLANFTFHPACDQEGFQLGGQVTQTPRWRDIGTVNGIRKIRLSTILVNACYKKDSSGQLGGYHYARRGYTFDLELDQNGHFLRTSVEFLAKAIQADLDAISTLEFLTMKYSKQQVKVGEEMTLTMQVKSYTDLQPHTCNFGISNEGAALQNGGYPVVSEIPNCHVKILNEDLWEISASMKIPASMKSGNYFPRMIKVIGEGKPDVALLVLPEINGFRVDNERMMSAFSVQSLEVLNLTPVSKFNDRVITNSYIYQPGQKIEIRINVNILTSVRIKGIGIYSIAVVNNQLQAVRNTGSIETFSDFKMHYRTFDAGPGQKIIVLTFTIPEHWQNAQQFGLSIQQIYLEDDSFQQSSWKASGDWDHLLIDQRLFDANR